MAYSGHVSHQNIYKMSVYLDKMLDNPGIILTFPVETWAHLQIALHCAKVLKHPKYSKLRSKWILKRGDKCYAVPKGMKMPEKEPRFSDVINPILLLRRKTDESNKG